MRRLTPILFLLIAACASAPKPTNVGVRRPIVETPPERGDLIGLTVEELGQKFGAPDFQVREGDGTKLQWRGLSCVLDAYLYKPTSGEGIARVMHADARDRQGRDVEVAGCMAALAAR